MSKTTGLSRRAVLRGLGTAVALPWLEAMTTVSSLAAPSRPRPPRRMAFFYVPNGVNMSTWTPAAMGVDFSLPAALDPLKPFQKDLLVLSGLTLNAARPLGDGPGDHARAMSAFLTGRHPKKTHGADISVGISVDQLAAQKIGNRTRFGSLELGIERGLNAGNCDSGYSCAYSANLSWRTDSMPMAKEINPRLLFERLFANQAKGEKEDARAKRDRYNLSILDFVMEDAIQLKSRLGATDQRKLDEYLSGVREIELRLTREGRGARDEGRGNSDEGRGARGEGKALESSSRSPLAPRHSPLAMPAGIPAAYQEHVSLMLDLLALAFQGDLTRISTFVLANDGSNRSYPFIGVPDGHHDLSHHGGSTEKLEKLTLINRFHIEQFARFLGKLHSIREGEGNLLDNCMLVYGSGIGDGNRHNHDDLPILVAGKGGGPLRTGRHIRYSSETPLTNLYVAMLDLMGAPAKSFGDSTGPLAEL